MQKRLQEWRVILGSAFPSASNPYWRALPLRRMNSLLAGVFFTSAVAGLQPISCSSMFSALVEAFSGLS